MRAGVLAAAIALTAVAPAFAQDSGAEQSIVTGMTMSIKSDRCNIRTARQMTFDEARNSIGKHYGCVAVRGWWRNQVLYASAPPEDPDDAEPHVGLYGDWDKLKPGHKAVSVVAVGVLSDCAALRADEPGPLWGYCHNVVDAQPFLTLAQVVRRRPRR